MKNKESQKRGESTKSVKRTSSATSESRKKSTLEKDLAKQISSISEDQTFTKSQINRLKNFYYTTKWLPNSAFTTYFGKPAFENYGYGNTNPVYGGLLYGNYMLSHNINPIDGGNSPDTKQVYSSAMLKAFNSNLIRKPEPPRKTPEEIRNTPEELEEIRTRNPIFQLPNKFPVRDIIKPDLLESRYFKSGKNTNRKLSCEKINNHNENEVLKIDDILNNKKTKKKKLSSEITNTDFNPFNQGKVKLPKKNMKNSNSQEDKYVKMENNTKEYNDNYESQRQFYEKMLNQESNHRKIEIQKDLIQQEITNKEIKENNNKNLIEQKPETCLICQRKDSSNGTKSILKKKENPCLLAPCDINYANFCCIHGNEKKLEIDEMDPKNFKDRPPCALEKIIPAGKPIKKSLTVAELFK